MGIPKFFASFARRYPLIITPYKENPPKVDNLYLDMNGLIHHCTHSDDDLKSGAAMKAKTEEQMFHDIFAYLEKLFDAIQPVKRFFMAVDGVAPRAKINQQRQRRFRSAEAMLIARNQAIIKGEDPPEITDMFDSNCITPGTDFMERLNQQLIYFIKYKVHTDVRWQTCKVFYSSYGQPGEGEHKIVEFIRGFKSLKNYSGDETHCIYGLDADIIMLALATHEPRFLVFREVVTFPSSEQNEMKIEQDKAMGLKTNGKYSTTEDEFTFLYINVLRDYLHIELVENYQNEVREKIGEEDYETSFAKNIDFERVIDDFIFMSFLFGNDFVPTLPTIGIKYGHWDVMFKLYRSVVLPHEAHYIVNPNGAGINWEVLEAVLTELGTMELDMLHEREAREARFRENNESKVEFDMPPIPESLKTIEEYKNRYYRTKLGFADGYEPDSADMKNLVMHYTEALLWMQQYYYQGPPSWRWYYPYHYCPMPSDIKGLAEYAKKIKFQLETPFTPFQQLLACMPPSSAHCLPEPYRYLMTSETSPLFIINSTPLIIDREGASAAYEGVTIIPFLDERTILDAYKKVPLSQLSETHRSMNENKSLLLFMYDDSGTRKHMPLIPFFSSFPTLRICYTVVMAIDMPAYENFETKICKNYNYNEMEGWSTLASMRKYFEPEFMSNTVCTFGRISFDKSLALKMKTPTYNCVDDVMKFLGKYVMCGYPHFHRAKVVGIADINERVEEKKKNVSERIPYKNGKDVAQFKKYCEDEKKKILRQCGIKLEEIKVVFYAKEITGMRTVTVEDKMMISPKLSSDIKYFPADLCMEIDPAKFTEDPRYAERTLTMDDFGFDVIYNGSKFYTRKDGSRAPLFGTVAKIKCFKDIKKLELEVTPPPPAPKLPDSIKMFTLTSQWVPIEKVSEEIKVNTFVLRKICSSIRVSPCYDSLEIGLCFFIFPDRKSSGQDLTRLGFAKMVPSRVKSGFSEIEDVFSRMQVDDAGSKNIRSESNWNRAWNDVSRSYGELFLSHRAVSLLKEYVSHNAPFIEYLAVQSGSQVSMIEPQYFCTGIWKDKTPVQIAQEMHAFIEQTGISNEPMIRACDDAIRDNLVEELEKSVIEYSNSLSKTRISSCVISATINEVSFCVVKQAVGNNVFATSTQLPASRFRLGCRVVNCKASGSVPLGLRGTIVRLLGNSDAEIVFDDEFLTGTYLDGKLTTKRGGIVKLKYLLNITVDDPCADPPSGATPSTMDVSQDMLLKELPMPRRNFFSGTSPVRAATPSTPAASLRAPQRLIANEEERKSVLTSTKKIPQVIVPIDLKPVKKADVPKPDIKQHEFPLDILKKLAGGQKTVSSAKPATPSGTTFPTDPAIMGQRASVPVKNVSPRHIDDTTFKSPASELQDWGERTDKNVSTNKESTVPVATKVTTPCSNSLRSFTFDELFNKKASPSQQSSPLSISGDKLIVNNTPTESGTKKVESPIRPPSNHLSQLLKGAVSAHFSSPLPFSDPAITTVTENRSIIPKPRSSISETQDNDMGPSSREEHREESLTKKVREEIALLCSKSNAAGSPKLSTSGGEINSMPKMHDPAIKISPPRHSLGTPKEARTVLPTVSAKLQQLKQAGSPVKTPHAPFLVPQSVTASIGCKKDIPTFHAYPKKNMHNGAHEPLKAYSLTEKEMEFIDSSFREILAKHGITDTA